MHGGAQTRKQPAAEQHSFASESQLSSSPNVNEPVVVVVFVYVDVCVCSPGATWCCSAICGTSVLLKDLSSLSDQIWCGIIAEKDMLIINDVFSNSSSINAEKTQPFVQNNDITRLLKTRASVCSGLACAAAEYVWVS